MTSQHSVIEHRANYFFLKIEEDYIAIFPEEDTHRQCKAAILSILENWMNSKRTESDPYRNMEVYLSYPQFAKQMFGLFSRSTIIKCIRMLVIDGLVLSRPYVDSFNQKTFAYMLNIDMVNAKLRSLPERKGSVKVNGGSVNLNHPSVKVNGGSSKNELPSSKSKRNIDYIDNNIDSTQTDNNESIASPIVDAAHAPIDFIEQKQKRDTDPRMAAIHVKGHVDELLNANTDTGATGAVHGSHIGTHPGDHPGATHSTDRRPDMDEPPAQKGQVDDDTHPVHSELSSSTHSSGGNGLPARLLHKGHLVDDHSDYSSHSLDLSLAEHNHPGSIRYGSGERRQNATRGVEQAPAAPTDGPASSVEQIATVPPVSPSPQQAAMAPVVPTQLPQVGAQRGAGKSDTKEIQHRINAHRGYALEEKNDKIRESTAVKTWCNMHTVEEYEQVMEYLTTKDKYWKLEENKYRIGGLTLAKETPKALAALHPTPITQAPSKNGYEEQHAINMRKLEARKARLAANG